MRRDGNDGCRCNLTKTFKGQNGQAITAVKDVSLDIHEREVFSLLGPNGAGKTTLISMISGLLRPTGGDATIDGYSITREPLAAKRLLGVAPQEIALYPTLSARQNLEFFGRMYGLSGADLVKRADEVLDFTDLRDRQNDRIDAFSGGMKRRVNIGVGLIHKPQLQLSSIGRVGPFQEQNRLKLPAVYGFSEAVIPRPRNWGDHIHITGYWFLDEPGWTPPGCAPAGRR